ncbi:unnamed protein product [Pedinophyceae sp. YPF-701]|nr:unnamed protein product [Pedinophyceae sp. YPF-701]
MAEEPMAPDAAPLASQSEQVTVRLLLSNRAAGTIIGKGGGKISEVQALSATNIQLSRASEFFPGTNERIVNVSGTVNGILTALHLTVTRLKAEDPESVHAPGHMSDADPQAQEPNILIKMLVPNAMCGVIIGRGGETIRSFIQDSNALIRVSNNDQMVPGVQDRVLSVVGNVDQILRAIALILTRLMEHPQFDRRASNTSTTPSPSVPTPGTPMHAAPFLPVRSGADSGGMTTTAIAAVPDCHVGIVLGKGGKALQQLQYMTGCCIQVSARADLIPGTQNRKFVITGPPEGVQFAQFIIAQKAQAARAAAKDGAGGPAADAACHPAAPATAAVPAPGTPSAGWEQHRGGN